MRGRPGPSADPENSQAFLQLDPANPQHARDFGAATGKLVHSNSQENYDGIEKAALSAGLLK
ncbi:MAG: hypothetical protein IPJ36_11965 [Simplicispira sp.]|nr:hypothetical protein [Simplicispira sp.]